MKKYPKRIKQAIIKLDEVVSFSDVIRATDFGECVEIVIDRWGDTCTFRVYNNGEITER